MAYLLASHSVIMGCEGEGNEHCGLEAGLCGSCCKDAMAVAERNFLKAEKCAVGLGAGVISRV